ncbi:hypothetical protein KY386_03870, partial [Candidatus Parcubacteria bacterium]|nr:hypothetical protein [Candidatus Parcubacteria bacterium]
MVLVLGSVVSNLPEWVPSAQAAVSFVNASSASTNGAVSLTIATPTGVVQNDVMVAAITVRGGTGTLFVAPTGWTSLQRNDSGLTIGQEVFYRVAGATEPASYEWTWVGVQKASGVIVAYRGIDTASPIDVKGGQANASSTTITAPSVTTTASKAQLIGFFGQADGSTITADTMTDRIYVASGGGSPGSRTAIRGSDQIQAAVGATGTRTATSGTASVNIGQLVALRGIYPTLEQSAYRWFDNADSTDVGPALAAQNTPATLTSAGAAFRLRMLMHVGNTDMPAGSEQLKLQYAAKGAAANCANVPTGNFGDVNLAGVSWTQTTSASAWSARRAHSTAVFNSKLWVLGGYDGAYKNDVWSSSDGVTWTQATTAAPWSARQHHTTVVFDNKLWVIGGYDGATKNDVWSSSDGVTWTQATAAAAWSARNKHASTVFDNKLWVLGGYGGTYKNDVWSSWSSIITFKENPAPADGAALTANANDPAHGADAIVNQTYEEVNNFTSTSLITVGQDGKWDFALRDNGAPAGTAYCFRVVQSDGALLNTYSVIPEITTAASGGNAAPASPAALAQKKTTDVAIATGGWTNETSVKFAAAASDTDNP